MEPPKEEYIGDGVYVSYNGGVMRLRAPREDTDHIIYLELQEFQALIKFAAYNQCWVKESKG